MPACYNGLINCSTLSISIMISLPAKAAEKHVHIAKLPEKYSIRFFSKNRRLLLCENVVSVVEGYTLSKKLVYEEPIVCATYTTFIPDRTNADDPPVEALAVCLAKSAHIYYPDGHYYMVSFPFTVKKAYAFECGLLLERDNDQHQLTNYSRNSHSNTHNSHSGHGHGHSVGHVHNHHHGAQLAAHRFLTLVDPIGDFRVVTTLSTSVVTSHESLICFPASGVSNDRSLCATFNHKLATVSIYHIKPSTRNMALGPGGSGAGAMSSGGAGGGSGGGAKKRKNPSLLTPNPSKVLEDEILNDFHHPFAVSVSLNMEKKRTSTLLSGVSSIGRMGSETGFSDVAKSNHAADLHTLKKDMILTKISSVVFSATPSSLSASTLSYGDHEAVVLCNSDATDAHIHIFRLDKGHGAVYAESFLSLQCCHALPLCHPRFPGWLLVLKDPSTLYMFHPFLNISSPTINLAGHFPPASRLSSSFANKVALLSATGSSHVVDLILEPRNHLVATCLSTWRYLCGSKIYEHIWILWRAALFLDDHLDEWNAFTMMLLALVYPFDDEEEDPDGGTTENDITRLLPKARQLRDYFEFDYSFNDLTPYIAVTLHLIYEESLLDILANKNTTTLGFLLTQLITWMGWLDQWGSYYMIDPSLIDHTTRLLSVVLLYAPPNIFDALMLVLHSRRYRYLRFSQLVEEGDDVNVEITPRTCFVIAAFEALVSKNAPARLVRVLSDHHVTPGLLDTYPLGISIPIKECLLRCQLSPDPAWGLDTLALIGRPDLAAMMSPSDQWLRHSDHAISRDDVGSDANTVLEKGVRFAANSSHSDDGMVITKLIFDKDRRFFEICNLLSQTKVQTATISIDESLSEYDSTLIKREVAVLVAVRTLLLPLGRAPLSYASKKPLLTETFPIEEFNLNTLIAPSMTNIVFSADSIDPVIMDWGMFHNGAAAGLSVSKESRGITGSWVIFNKPVNNTAQHAGFLMGLGLNGHLHKLEEWHIYNYLGPKHPLTSVGLLIGMAASLKGSMDNKLTKVLSVHAVALLPVGANDLNVPILVQSAGLIGIGLLYLETQHRRMSDILLSQVCGSVPHIENDEDQEGYRLAAGIALGMINLGRGDSLRGLNDTHVVDSLLFVVTCLKDSQSDLDTDKCGSAAAMALLMIYMRSGNAAVAAKLSVPESEQLLDYVRPDLLLLRSMVKNVIMWDDIGATVLWVDSEVPECLRSKHRLGETVTELDSDQVSYFSVVGGVCLALALRHASSQNISARNTLLHFLDHMMILTGSAAANYDQKICLNSASQIQNLLAVCSAIVMAGSGDLEVFRRLRVLHGRISKTLQYGNHVATNMALGFLFLGGGQYGFRRDNFSLACLAVSVYPVFPSGLGHAEVHLEALRHFWALAVEPRCLVVKDVASGNPVKIPVCITGKDGSIRRVMTPLLISEPAELGAVSVDEPEFFPLRLDLLAESAYTHQFMENLVVFVLKKNNHELLRLSVASCLQRESKRLQRANGEVKADDTLEKLVELSIMDPLTDFEKQVYLQESDASVRTRDTSSDNAGLSFFNIIDSKTELSRMASRPSNVQELKSLKLLFLYGDIVDEFHYVTSGYVEQLKQTLWDVARMS